MFNLFGKQPVTEIKLQIIQRDPSRITLEEWKSDKTLCTEARKCLENPILQRLLDVVRNAHPSWQVLNYAGTVEERAFRQAQAEGYTMCIATLLSLAEYEQPKEQLEADFSQSDEIKVL
jgi:hypothetical protein